MGAYIAIAALSIQLVFLAVVLSVVGIAVNKLINSYLASRTDSSNKSKALVNAARSRANRRVKVSTPAF